jgi:hypothetical protein
MSPSWITLDYNSKMLLCCPTVGNLQFYCWVGLHGANEYWDTSSGNPCQDTILIVIFRVSLPSYQGKVMIIPWNRSWSLLPHSSKFMIYNRILSYWMLHNPGRWGSIFKKPITKWNCVRPPFCFLNMHRIIRTHNNTWITWIPRNDFRQI